MDKNLSQVYSTENSESESVIFNESSTDKRESEIVLKSSNTKKYAIYETEHDEPLVTDNPVINNPRYLNL